MQLEKSMARGWKIGKRSRNWGGKLGKEQEKLGKQLGMWPGVGKLGKGAGIGVKNREWSRNWVKNQENSGNWGGKPEKAAGIGVENWEKQQELGWKSRKSSGNEPDPWGGNSGNASGTFRARIPAELSCSRNEQELQELLLEASQDTAPEPL